MLRDLKSLGRDTVIYGLSTVVGRLVNVFLLPIYTHYLAPGDYGVASTVFAYLAFLNVVYAYGMDLAFMRFSGRGKDGETGNFSTPFFSVAATSILLSAAIYVFAGPVARLADVPPGLENVVKLSAWILALDAIAIVPFAELRLARRATAYAGIKTANIILNVALTYFFLGRLRLGVPGVFLAAMAASSATLTMLAPVVAKKLEFKFDRPLHKEMLHFGLPLIPAGIASMVVQVIDRPIMMRMSGDAAVGIYTANYKLGIFMQLIINMFDMAWRPFILPRAESPDVKRLIARVLTYFCAGSAVVVIAVSLFIRDVVALPLLGGKPLIHPDYWSGLPVVPWVLLAYFFNGVYYNFLTPVNLAKRNDLVAVATALGAIVNVAAILILLPRWGIVGAAAATLLAYVVMACVLYFLAQKVYPVDYEWARLTRVAAAFSASGALAWYFWDSPLWSRGLIVLTIPVILAASGFVAEDERAALRRRLARSA